MIQPKSLLLRLLQLTIVFFAYSIFAQSIVKGEIYDNLGNPLPGVAIIVKGTTNGTQTDFDGKYVINIKKADATLVVSYLGFETKKVKVGDQKIINIIYYILKLQISLKSSIELKKYENMSHIIG